MFLFNYDVIDERYHAGSRGEYLDLFKGAPRIDPKKGMTSNALKKQRLDHLEDVVRTIEQGDHERIRKVIDKHTSYYLHTPFLSATTTP